MRVLLTGASGYLGQHVLEGLRRRGIDIVLLGRHRPVGVEELPLLAMDMLDCGDMTAAVRDVGASHLIHLAWYTEHGKYWNSPLNLRWVDATLRLLQAFTEQGGKHAVITGTCAEYEWSGDLPLREDVTPLNPASLYGVAKDATRRLAQAWCRDRGVTLTWGHVFFPFGIGEARQRMVPSLIEVFRGRAAPFCVNVDAWRGMLPVRDAAEALVHLLTQGCDGRYNICSGQAVQVGEVVRTLARICHAEPAALLAMAAPRAGDPKLLVGDNTLLKATGWRPTQTLEQGLHEMVFHVDRFFDGVNL